MAMRMTGLMSGLDTESIIQELVSAKSTKVETTKKAQTKLEWKQDVWKSLNTKLKSLQTKYISNMRFTDSYSKKTTNVSNSSAVSVITGENAMNGVQELKIKQLAKTSYLTGAKVSKTDNTDNSNADALTKLTDLGVTAGEILSVTTGDGTTEKLEITDSTSISDVLNTLKDAGLNASFDASNQRFFVSSSKSGTENNFEITSSGTTALSALGLEINTTTEEEFKSSLADVSEEEAEALWQAEKQKYATKIDGQDAVIELNGAEFISSTNVFEINGLTITALSTTAENEVVTVTTQDDVDGIYDMVKNFLTEYNSVINEIDKLYNADSAKGYEPLTDEEKESLSESEIEKYEQKIKDALLRGDSTLSSIRSSLIQTMSSGIKVNDKTMYLYDFGIETLGYFEAADNEKNAYHIAGDEDDENTSGDADVLKSMISTDPETVISFFSELCKNLYSEMSNLSSSVDGYRSYGSFYDDKKMSSDYDDYTSKIEDYEEELNDYEDKWYDKFSAMETALAKLQSNTNAITSLLGGS